MMPNRKTTCGRVFQRVRAEVFLPYNMSRVATEILSCISEIPTIRVGGVNIPPASTQIELRAPPPTGPLRRQFTSNYLGRPQ